MTDELTDLIDAGELAPLIQKLADANKALGEATIASWEASRAEKKAREAADRAKHELRRAVNTKVAERMGIDPLDLPLEGSA